MGNYREIESKNLLEQAAPVLRKANELAKRNQRPNRKERSALLIDWKKLRKDLGDKKSGMLHGILMKGAILGHILIKVIQFLFENRYYQLVIDFQKASQLLGTTIAEFNGSEGRRLLSELQSRRMGIFSTPPDDIVAALEYSINRDTTGQVIQEWVTKSGRFEPRQNNERNQQAPNSPAGEVQAGIADAAADTNHVEKRTELQDQLDDARTKLDQTPQADVAAYTAALALVTNLEKQLDELEQDGIMILDTPIPSTPSGEVPVGYVQEEVAPETEPHVDPEPPLTVDEPEILPQPEIVHRTEAIPLGPIPTPEPTVPTPEPAIPTPEPAVVIETTTQPASPREEKAAILANLDELATDYGFTSLQKILKSLRSLPDSATDLEWLRSLHQQWLKISIDAETKRQS